jgi:D-alanyl-lipoteichoic acid acyltransferase DltB (MBOAT superfamily)
MSLSQWLRDYLYIPLGGSHLGRRRTYVNAVATMVICGLWHGAAWTYVVWGLYQGLWMALHRFLVRERGLIRAPRWLAVAVSFHLTCLGYVLFRSTGLGQAWVAYSSLWRTDAPAFALPSWEVWLCLAIGPLTHLAAAWPAARALWGRLHPGAKALAYACALALIFLWAPRQETFIYAGF